MNNTINVNDKTVGEVVVFQEPKRDLPARKSYGFAISVVLSIGSVCLAGAGIREYIIERFSRALIFFGASGASAAAATAIAIMTTITKSQNVGTVIKSRFNGESLLENRSDATTIAGACAILNISDSDIITKELIEEKKKVLLNALNSKLTKAQQIVEKSRNKAQQENIPILRYEKESPLIEATRIQIQQGERAYQTLINAYP